jgi:GT2 family glycosyltransferase
MSLTIAVLVTVHNRRDTTLECLKRLMAQTLPDCWSIQVYLVDDGSSDGTSAAVLSAFPLTTVIPGDGTLFWCEGMRLAWSRAANSNPEYYMWLNDDTYLRPGCLERLLSISTLCCKRAAGYHNCRLLL